MGKFIGKIEMWLYFRLKRSTAKYKFLSITLSSYSFSLLLEVLLFEILFSKNFTLDGMFK